MKKIVAVSFLLFVVFFNANAQCSFAIGNLSDSITLCKNASIQLNPTIVSIGNPPIFLDTTWNKITGLSDSNILNPLLTVGATGNTYILTVNGVSGNELLANGNFSIGNTAFTSAYVYGTGGTWGLLSNDGQFAISTDPLLTHSNFASFGDHTSGTGNMMVINGSTIANVSVWCQTITVMPNTWYNFSAWGASCVASNPANLQFSINGTLVGTQLPLSATTGVWSQFNANWFSGTNTIVNICITDQTTAPSGNDFAIDDISFREYCTVKDTIKVGVINLTPNFTYTVTPDCLSDAIKCTSTSAPGNTPSSYSWIWGDGNFSNTANPTHTYTSPNTYTIKLITFLKGCKDSVSKTVNNIHPVFANFTTPDTTCEMVSFNLQNLSFSTLASTFIINWGDGTNGTALQHTYNVAGTYTIQLILTNIIGCADTFEKKIIILGAPYINFSLLDSVLCVGEPVLIHDTINKNVIDFTFDFDGKQSFKNQHQTMYNYLNSGTYYIAMTGTNGVCPVINVKRAVIVNNLPVVKLYPDTLLCINNNKSITLEGPFGCTYLWNTGETTKDIVVTDGGKYWLQAQANGCSNADSVLVKRDCYLNIPNAFTPNSQNINNRFMPLKEMSSGVVAYDLQIFNRWGETVFTTTNINSAGWDGTFGEKEQPMGVYVYAIKVILSNGQQKLYHGNVTLVR
jgi:gliding motility-associated-like protein